MNKIIKYFAILVVLVSFCSVLAQNSEQNIQIQTSGNRDTIYTLEKSTVDINITNIGLNKDTCYIGVWPSQWVSIDKYFVSLESGKSDVIKMTVEPPIDAEMGNTVFIISAKSIDSGAIASQQLILNIRRRAGTYISDIKFNQQNVKPGDTVLIQPLIVNLEKSSKHVFISTKILKDRLLVKDFEDEIQIDPTSTKTVTIPFLISNNYDVGTYYVDVSMTDMFGQPIHKKVAKDAFQIQNLDNVKQEKNVERGLLYTNVVINITNIGNIVNSNFTVSESMSKLSKYFFYPETEPTSQEVKDNRVVYTWNIAGLDPNESRLIKYQLRFTNAVIISGILLLIVFLVITYYHKPTLMKKYSGFLSQDKEAMISLHVKNNSTRELVNTVVKDHVPSIAVVVKEFDTLQPEIRRTHNGTDLVWKVDKLKPKEERIITYKIKPVINVEGSFTLPKARFTYKTGKGIIHKIAEKFVISVKKIK